MYNFQECFALCYVLLVNELSGRNSDLYRVPTVKCQHLNVFCWTWNVGILLEWKENLYSAFQFNCIKLFSKPFNKFIFGEASNQKRKLDMLNKVEFNLRLNWSSFVSPNIPIILQRGRIPDFFSYLTGKSLLWHSEVGK